MEIRKLLVMSIFQAASLLSSQLPAAEVSIAVAANFTDATRALVPLFERTTGHKASISYGSTGKLFSQIENGAPYDVFLAADALRVAKAEEQGLAVPGSCFVYARGTLVLWSTNKPTPAHPGIWLSPDESGHIAIANPKTAPYGLAARQVLEHLGVWQDVQPRLVYGDSISQTFQFVASGNAEFGFVAASQIKAWPENPGTSWVVPADYHEPIEQSATLLRKGETNPAALAFLVFLKSEAAREVITSYGYGVAEGKVATRLTSLPLAPVTSE